MQPRKLYQRAKASLRNRLGLPVPLVEAELLGRRLRVRYGSVRSQPDKDGAWLLACACHAEHVVDIGANIGQAALLMLQAPTLRSITLVDPNVEALAVAADNLIRNRMSDRARFIPVFVSDEDDRTITLWTVGVGSAGSRYPGH
ncbi:MAG: methyltransferase, partial [Proteobacteria bacterium]|nr:methyltransferase [Pseudomonadota bacterium]